MVSVWPLLVSLSLYLIIFGLVCFLQAGVWAGIVGLVFSLFFWLVEDSVKLEKEGVFSMTFQEGCKLGVLLFIFSEFLFFSSLLVSSVFLVESWDESVVVDMDKIPLFISVILLSSGVTMTLTHQALLGKTGYWAVWLFVTLLLGIVFVSVQIGEWEENGFGIMTGVGGSLFYLITGFHGIHVGLGFILNLYLLFLLNRLGCSRALGYWAVEGIIWYWHFVDVVWLLVYLVVYWYCM